ncbi:pentatricopeptide repeat-containing protein At1g06143-like [Amborella trichopoda]|uniref:pentatricopeptide repeat-containing protein At1g06143-like n=1 Tax=Amborella trichopoda TaxID=13333 RepID=UPI0009C14EBF|nr:pentatricopeptide repeat-containing protein At1g06143-like [Amborella trichopoda]|eukprot:XP_020517952.1 pentatricopeptide repeat-containing protein At1g06143-like [Amborella trichopoda]
MAGKTEHGHLENRVFVGTVRIDLYLNCSEIGNARKVFDEMEVKDAITFTPMISGHCRIGELSFSQELFDVMPEINTASWNALIDGYLKGGDIEKAASLFDEMSHKDLVSWTTMTSRFSKNGRFKEAAVFKEMEAQVVSPDAVTMATMI